MRKEPMRFSFPGNWELGTLRLPSVSKAITLIRTCYRLVGKRELLVLLSYVQMSKKRNVASRKQQKNKTEAKWNRDKKLNASQ
jgi:hypothetical protein